MVTWQGGTYSRTLRRGNESDRAEHIHSFTAGLIAASSLLRAGAQLASELGLSMTQFDPPSSSCPGYEWIELCSTSTSRQKEVSVCWWNFLARHQRAEHRCSE